MTLFVVSILTTILNTNTLSLDALSAPPQAVLEHSISMLWDLRTLQTLIHKQTEHCLHPEMCDCLMLYSLHQTISSTGDVAHTCLLASRKVSSMIVGSKEMFIDPMSKQVVECMLILITVIIINIFHMAKCI